MAFDDPECRPIVVDWAYRNLGGIPPSEPNLWLDPAPEFAPLLATRDVEWWLRATRALRLAVDASDAVSRTLLARRLFVLEAYPYPMRTNPGRRLPTHDYTAHLLNAWLESGRPVVVGRGVRAWCELVPPLATALRSGQAQQVRNVQAATISPGNLPEGESGFRSLVRLLAS
jgi:hypothetical protein